MKFEFLETKRLKLRKLTPEVLQFVFQNYSDSDLIDFIGLKDMNELKKEKTNHKNGLSTYNKTFLYFQIIPKDSNEVIGWCGFHTWYLNHKRAEIGYVLNTDTWKNKGIMTEAMEPVINYGFGKMDLHRIEAFVGLDNDPSLKLLKKYKFEQEGHLNEHYLRDGIFEDSLLYALLQKNSAGKK